MQDARAISSSLARIGEHTQAIGSYATNVSRPSCSSSKMNPEQIQALEAAKARFAKNFPGLNFYPSDADFLNILSVCIEKDVTQAKIDGINEGAQIARKHFTQSSSSSSATAAREEIDADSEWVRLNQQGSEDGSSSTT